jgi:glutathione synthase/RimK-type ligase-like ATP-grasp enzyme
MRLTVVGNPGSRRVALLTEAALRAGLKAPAVLPWRTILTGGSVRFPEHSWVRIESPGEDAEVDWLLRGAAEPAEHGEIVGGAAWYEGFCAALGRVEEGALHSGARLLAQPADIREMFDKVTCHARLTEAGIPVPAAFPGPVLGWEQLRSELPWSRAFVKPRFGSSASGVIALELGSRGRVVATTSVELAGGRLYNSLRVRRYRDEADVAAIVDRLAPEGLHVERWFPKADVEGYVMDMRVVVVNGKPSHAVGRGSRQSPMTNLHLGGKRIDASVVRAAAGAQAYESAMRTCAEVGAAFPRTQQMGVDLMFGMGFRQHAVAEVNAFGDLLPGLLADGVDTYGAQLRALMVPA